MNDMSDGARKVVDLAAAGLAGVAAISLAQAALIVSFLAGLLSIVLAGIRIYDRLKYGPGRE